MAETWNSEQKAFLERYKELRVFAQASESVLWKAKATTEALAKDLNIVDQGSLEHLMFMCARHIQQSGEMNAYEQERLANAFRAFPEYVRQDFTVDMVRQGVIKGSIRNLLEKYQQQLYQERAEEYDAVAELACGPFTLTEMKDSKDLKSATHFLLICVGGSKHEEYLKKISEGSRLFTVCDRDSRVHRLVMLVDKRGRVQEISGFRNIKPKDNPRLNQIALEAVGHIERRMGVPVTVKDINFPEWNEVAMQNGELLLLSELFDQWKGDSAVFDQVHTTTKVLVTPDMPVDALVAFAEHKECGLLNITHATEDQREALVHIAGGVTSNAKENFPILPNLRKAGGDVSNIRAPQLKDIGGVVLIADVPDACEVRGTKTYTVADPERTTYIVSRAKEIRIVCKGEVTDIYFPYIKQGTINVITSGNLQYVYVPKNEDVGKVAVLVPKSDVTRIFLRMIEGK